jgi:hypothetical protein
MTRKHDVDPVDTMFKAMRLAEAVAAREQAKGEAANLKIMADSMMQAASMAEKIAALQDRRGTAPLEVPPKVELEVIARCMDCGKRFDTADMAPERSPSDHLPRTIEHDLHAAHPNTRVKPVAYDPASDVHRIKAPVKDFTPPKPVEDPNRRKTPAELNAISRNFHAGGFSKDAANGGALDQWLGAHTSPTRPFEPALDPNMKPRTEGS